MTFDELGLSAPLAERMINFTIRWEATAKTEREAIEEETVAPPTVKDVPVGIDLDRCLHGAVPRADPAH